MAPTPGPIPATSGQVAVEEPTYHNVSRKSVTVNTKGLLNMPGQNNCFLNSAVQVLWHLDAFRRSFRELSGHSCMAESCIFCALKELFTQFQYSQESALPPDALRHALAKTFCDQRRFQLGFMDDAAECFENILLRIHVHIANQEMEDMCGNPYCIPHQMFAMTLVEQRICHNCGATSEPLPFTQMVHYVTTSALCSKFLETQENDLKYKSQSSFGRFLRLAGDMGEVRNCPSGCGAKVQVTKTLMNHPEVVSIGLVWDSECPTLQHITDVFHSIGMYIQLQEMFHHVFDMAWANITTHQLVGVVTYYGKHYSTFFFHTKLRIWIYFDDATVREVGPSWEQVVEKCQKGRFQPLLLLFANPNCSFDIPRQEGSTQDTAFTYDMNNKCTSANQRQVVIRQYLMFQNSLKNGNFNSVQGHSLNGGTQDKYPTHAPYSFSAPTSNDQNLPLNLRNGNQTSNSQFYYNQRQANNSGNQSAPVYSNLQHLTSSQLFHHDQKDMTKMNEVSLPSTMSVTSNCSRNSIQSYSEIPHVYNSTSSVQGEEKKDYDGAKDSDSAFTEDDRDSSDMYINRKTVENVLNFQKKQMSLSRSCSQSSIGKRNSSSSLDSFDNLHSNKLAPKNAQESNTGRRDSGSWSSDRNSSSSNNSIENPFLTVVASKRLLLGLNNLHNAPKRNQLPDYSNTNVSDHGYDSYSVSSSDSYPSVNGSPVKLEPRLTQIPEDWQPEDDTDLDTKLKLVTETSPGPPDCDKLCAEADLLLAKSHEKEKDGDLVMAALLCDSAAARARAAMEAPYNNSKSLVSAKMKHSTCVMRSSNLYRRLKDHELDERRKQKAHTGHHSRQSSRDSTHSRHSRQGSKDSTHSKTGNKDTNNHSDDTDNFGKNIEIYGTLPKKGSRKKASGTLGTTKVKDDQVYKDFLDKQRKNTNTSNEPNDATLKNTDVISNRSDGNAKIKTQANNEKQQRKICNDDIQAKSPTRKKSDSPATKEQETKKKAPKQQNIDQSYLGLFPGEEFNEMQADRDLLSPVTSPDKKQHKIKRKLMGGFMKRKNRSLPDLREDQYLSDSMNHFLDDAIIQVPPMLTLPNGKLKKLENQGSSNLGTVTRGFHQPHHAFVKKDLTQRPLLMKVNPPNIQPSILANTKTKLVHTLPSLPKKSPETSEKIESIPITNAKPSKIPFMPTISKSDIGVLPPLPAPKTVDHSKCSKFSSPQKASSIPVLASQGPLSPLKTSSVPKEDSKAANDQFQIPNTITEEGEDLPQPTNPFLAELQAKRKQVLNKSPEKETPVETSPTQLNFNKELSLLPKLALHAEGTSWLKELQSKQRLILNKQDDKAFSHPKASSSSNTKVEMDLVDIKDIGKLNSQRKLMPSSLKNQKDIVEMEKKTTTNVSNDTNCSNSSVKDLASRFEKVLFKPKEVSTPPPVPIRNGGEQTLLSNEEQKQHINVVDSKCTVENTMPQIQYNLGHTNSAKPVNIALPLKSVLKVRSHDASDSSTNDTTVRVSESSVKPLKPALKRSSIESSSNMPTPNANSTQRPIQPPDYATAMQRLEFIRSDANLRQPEVDSAPQLNANLDIHKPKSGPKKSVTFSDEVVLVACAEYEEIDFSSNPLFERVYQEHLKAGKGAIPILSQTCNLMKDANTFDNSENNEAHSNTPSQCNLCHSKYVTQPSMYCSDCEFYLSKYKA